jgi:hypothetical protein
MNSEWKEQDLDRALRALSNGAKDHYTYDRVWARIESSLSERAENQRGHQVWRPLGHPIRWVLAASFLFVAFGGVLYQNHLGDQADLNAYLLNISNPTENIARDPGYVKVSSVISEVPSQEAAGILIGDEDHPGSPSNGADLLL